MGHRVRVRVRFGKILVGLIAAAAATATTTPALADTVQLGAQKDNMLIEPFSPNFDIRSNGQGPGMIVGRTNGGFRKRSAVAFDIAGNIPPGSTINSVTLRVVVNRIGDPTPRTVDLHRFTADWGEGASNTGTNQQGQGEPAEPGDVTWLHTFFPDQLWTTEGGDFDATPSGSTQFGNTGSYTFLSTAGMVADVQTWLDDPSGNFGWILIGDESIIGTTKRLSTRENGNVLERPLLTVDYTPQGPLGACCVAGGTFEGVGTSCSPNPCVEPFGACCENDGTCTEVTETTCLAQGNDFRGGGSTCASPGCPIVLTPFIDPLPIPPVAVPVAGQPGGAATYDIEMVEFQQSLHSELPPTTLWGYDDGVGGPRVPGPTIEARSDETVTVHWINDLAELQGGAPRTDHYLDVDTACIHGAQDLPKAVVHLHGAHVEAEFDGYPEDTFLPGSSEQYVYGNGQLASTLWYHDHALGITRLNVYMGLAGLYNIRDDVEDAIDLPAGPYEIPLVLMDRTFNPDGTLYYPSVWQDHFFGETILVNGKIWPYLDVDRGKYRFRVLNASGSRFYTLSLTPPTGTLPLTVIGTEGGLLEAPVVVDELTLGPAERYDIVVDFEGLDPGDVVLLENRAGAPFPNGANDIADVMKFVVGSGTGDTAALPSTLRPVVPIPEGDAVATRDFRLARGGNDGCGRQSWLINGLAWDDIVEYPELGTVEIWRFANESGVAHPM
ncbi:MAG: multicopper oxidase domain-containing protein, partial [Acidobacteriota bacterium]|nr:multicopper oxidase domain-containing protein [Acidobacteriota bacterium]